MAKLQVSDWDTVAANNTDINSIPIDGAVTTPSQVDNIVREMMAQIKTFSTTVTLTVGVSVDNTVPRFDGVAGALQTSGVTIADTNAMTITSTSAGTLLTVTSTEAGAGSGPDLVLFRDSASPAVSDNLSMINWRARDSGGNDTRYATIDTVLNSPTDTAESATLRFITIRSGTLSFRAHIAAGFYMEGATGGDPGAGKINATGFQKAGVEFGNDVADQVITGGARITSLSLGTITTGTVTPDPGDRPMQHYTNGGAHTLAPGSNNGFYTLDITNNGSAGTITTSGWTKVSGSVFTTTNGHKFRCSCSVGDAGSLLSIQAMQ